jgi:hypothetical protein
MQWDAYVAAGVRAPSALDDVQIMNMMRATAHQGRGDGYEQAVREQTAKESLPRGGEIANCAVCR